MASTGGKADLFTETSRVYFETKKMENFYNQVWASGAFCTPSLTPGAEVAPFSLEDHHIIDDA